ncbi:hypothetical protein L6452_37950 [Arctium lappa]|uniref:Uncharacterized protein n=1 Tax=Arctium lappa TaxID=4217 RepID=A0ACB8Y5I7_ARCLA|nr:hypothetical protein L6452_37950 [Arctium lappa]
MSSPQQQTTINPPTSLKIQLAYRFHQALNNLNNGTNTNFDNTRIEKRSRRVKIAAYASMASVAGSRRAWSRAILSKIRNRARNYKKKVVFVVDRKIITGRRCRRRVLGFTRRRNTKVKREDVVVDPIGDSGLEVKLRKLVPGAETMDSYEYKVFPANLVSCFI